MPKYDFRCDRCGQVFEVTRSFSAASEPAACPHDGAEAARVFSPPLDLLVYGREPLVPAGRVAIPPDALSCHDHGPPPASAQLGEAAAPSGSRWHAHGYEDAGSHDGSQGQAGHTHGRGRGHTHPHGHRH